MMPAEKNGKSTIRKAPYNALPRRLHEASLITLSSSSERPSGFVHAHPLPLGTLWQSSPDSPYKTNNELVSRLTEYLKSKNELYKEELGKMEDALSKAEETKNTLKQTISTLGKTVEELEGAVTAASHILSASLVCSICFENSTLPTSLKCGHSFCRDCLQCWFLSKFEDRCAIKGIKLTSSKYQYIYKPASSANEIEHNMLAFAALSNLIKPDYSCPTCRDPLVPSVRNSYSDFKLTASLTTLNALIGYVPPAPPEWKLASVDMLGFLNSRFFSRRFSAEANIDIEMEMEYRDLLE